MNVANAVASVLVTKKSLKQFKDIVEAETGRTVTDPLALLQACLQVEARSPDSFAYAVTDSGILSKFDFPGLKKKKSK